ncbi:hypothetical protein RB653_000487 [Dictyostelium firmibasis]|uniref:DJ-1/PfpI domain-containing protein n=1 Tax=Dictyostelium firmibasis TaxID=79012 RepID=A0AAN7TVB1_9MYCE
MEFTPFVDVMGWAREDDGGDDEKADIRVITCGFNKMVTSTFGVTVQVDEILSDIKSFDEYDALAIPGGFENYSFYEEAYSEVVSQLIRDFDSKNKFIATVCVGALALGKSGILKGRNATTYRNNLRQHSVRQQQLKDFGANVIENQSIVIDNNIITSYNPQTAPYVAFKLLEFLTNENKAKTTKILMGF